MGMEIIRNSKAYLDSKDRNYQLARFNIDIKQKAGGAERRDLQAVAKAENFKHENEKCSLILR